MNSNTIIPLAPFPLLGTSGTQINIINLTVALNTNASFGYTILDSGNNIIVNGRNSITPAQYSGWSSSDNYIVNCILSNLNLTAAAPILDTPVATIMAANLAANSVTSSISAAI